MHVSGSVVIKMRSYLSSHHLFACKHFGQLAASIENECTGQQRFRPDHRAYVSGAIFSAVAFLEAAINEIFQDTYDRKVRGKPAEFSGALDPMVATAMAGVWGTLQEHDGKGKLKILEKYNLALILAGGAPFDTGVFPYQDAALIIKLRNELVHYKPRWLGGEEIHTLEKNLKGKFPLNMLYEQTGNPFFPDKCLGYGCAEWAFRTSKGFADDFFSRIGVTPNYQQVDFIA